jgi:hypothetical protein
MKRLISSSVSPLVIDSVSNVQGPMAFISSVKMSFSSRLNNNTFALSDKDAKL